MKFGITLALATSLGFANIQKDEFGGIGVQLDSTASGWTISKVFENSPAQAAGLLSGDRIISGNDFTLLQANREFTLSTLRGSQGSKLDLVISRQGQSLEFTLTRTQIKTATAIATDVGLSPSSTANFAASTLLSDKASVYDANGNKLNSTLGASASHSIFALEMAPISSATLQNPLDLPNDAMYLGNLYNAKGEVVHSWQGQGSKISIPQNTLGASYFRVTQGSYTTQGLLP